MEFPDHDRNSHAWDWQRGGNDFQDGVPDIGIVRREETQPGPSPDSVPSITARDTGSSASVEPPVPVPVASTEGQPTEEAPGTAMEQPQAHREEDPQPIDPTHKPQAGESREAEVPADEPQQTHEVDLPPPDDTDPPTARAGWEDPDDNNNHSEPGEERLIRQVESPSPETVAEIKQRTLDDTVQELTGQFRELSQRQAQGEQPDLPDIETLRQALIVGAKHGSSELIDVIGRAVAEELHQPVDPDVIQDLIVNVLYASTVVNLPQAQTELASVLQESRHVNEILISAGLNVSLQPSLSVITKMAVELGTSPMPLIEEHAANNNLRNTHTLQYVAQLHAAKQAQEQGLTLEEIMLAQRALVEYTTAEAPSFGQSFYALAALPTTMDQALIRDVLLAIERHEAVSADSRWGDQLVQTGLELLENQLGLDQISLRTINNLLGVAAPDETSDGEVTFMVMQHWFDDTSNPGGLVDRLNGIFNGELNELDEQLEAGWATADQISQAQSELFRQRERQLQHLAEWFISKGQLDAARKFLSAMTNEGMIAETTLSYIRNVGSLDQIQGMIDPDINLYPLATTMLEIAQMALRGDQRALLRAEAQVYRSYIQARAEVKGVLGGLLKHIHSKLNPATAFAHRQAQWEAERDNNLFRYLWSLYTLDTPADIVDAPKRLEAIRAHPRRGATTERIKLLVTLAQRLTQRTPPATE